MPTTSSPIAARSRRRTREIPPLARRRCGHRPSPMANPHERHPPRRRHRLQPGDLVDLPPPTPHGYRITGDRPARFLAWTIGSPMDQFFAGMAERVQPLPRDSPAMQERRATHGVEWVNEHQRGPCPPSREPGKPFPQRLAEALPARHRTRQGSHRFVEPVGHRLGRHRCAACLQADIDGTPSPVLRRRRCVPSCLARCRAP